LDAAVRLKQLPACSLHLRLFAKVQYAPCHYWSAVYTHLVSRVTMGHIVSQHTLMYASPHVFVAHIPRKNLTIHSHRIDTAPVVYIVAISGFEIGIKVQQGKLHLPVPPADWFTAVLTHHHVEVLALTLDMCLRSTALPPLHADPCDRMIIAAAQLYHLPVVSTDPLFAPYGIEVIS